MGPDYHVDITGDLGLRCTLALGTTTAADSRHRRDHLPVALQDQTG